VRSKKLGSKKNTGIGYSLFLHPYLVC